MIFGAFERMVARRYLRARRAEGFVSVIAGFSLLGIALGVATLIIVMSVMNGFRSELMGTILGVNGHLTVMGQDRNIADYEAARDRLLDLENVVTATPQVQGQVMVTNQSQAVGALIRGLSGDDLAKRDLVTQNLAPGALEDFSVGKGVLIGSRMSQKLGIGVGQQITLVSPRSTTTVIGSVPRMKSYTVVGLFEVGMYEYDNSIIFMPLPLAQVFFQMEDLVNAIEIFVENPDRVWLTSARVSEAIGPGYRSVDWQQANSSFFNALQVERNVMFLILTLIIVVAAFNIISGQIMLVKDKGRDIAILRTMGATRGMILRIFLMSGAAIGIAGTLAGLILGVLFVENITVIQGWVEAITGSKVFDPEIRFLTDVPAEMDFNEVVVVVAMSLALTLSASIYPSWRAARLDPVEALRYE
ncbi:MAG: lipoprotein-releasing ABC transporter permease subunit [Rhodovibrionaceae bacterium]